MNTLTSTLRATVFAGVLALTSSAPALADEDAPVEATATAEGAVQTHADEQRPDKRKAIIAEAETAIRETRAALAALDENKTEDALAALERATGKLEIVIARDPALALATTGVSTRTFDVIGTVRDIEAARARAETYLEDGEVQKARRVLESLASEVVVSVTKVPLATYPEAIKKAVALIDDGKTDEAKSALEVALNTLVITDHVIPLPVTNAEALLKEAEALAKNDDRTLKENETLSKLLERARSELKVAEALGYGGRKDYAGYFAEIEKIEQATRGQAAEMGLFDKLRSSLSKLRDKLSG